MIRYVVGFAFNEAKGKVLLVTKLKPEWQKGYLNGIGGKIEQGESPLFTMDREAIEETGLKLGWTERGIMRGVNSDGNSFWCHIFYAYSDKIYEFKQIEEERLRIYSIRSIWLEKYIDNVPLLIEFGLSKDKRPFMQLDYGTGL